MTDVLTEPSATDLLIDRLDLEALAVVLTTGADGQKPLTDDEADQAIRDYKMFLALITRTDEPVVPTITIDRVWHAHLLDSAHYRDACDRIFGGYLDHWPYLGMMGDTVDLLDQFGRTCDLYHKYFGTVPGGLCADAMASSCSHDGCKEDLLARPRPTR